MGANAQTTVPTFSLGQVLTGDQMNQSARTGVPVFADTTARDAAFGGTGEKTLAEGQLCYLEDSNVVQYYDGSTWATVGPTAPVSPGLELVKTQTIGSAVSSVVVTGAFSATYDNYKIMLSGGTGSVNDELINIQLGSTTTGYYASYVGTTYSTNAVTPISNNNASSWTRFGSVLTDGLFGCADIISPNLAKNTYIVGGHAFDTASRTYAGFLKNTTAYTAFTLIPASGTLTGGTIKVYGYKN